MGNANRILLEPNGAQHIREVHSGAHVGVGLNDEPEVLPRSTQAAKGVSPYARRSS